MNVARKPLRALIAPALAVAILFLAGPAAADPPPWAPAWGHHSAPYRYQYYPRHEAYYAPERSLWFWFADGDWRVGARLPVHFRVNDGPNVWITLDSDRPYVSHHRVLGEHRWRGDHHEFRPHERHRWRERQEDRHLEWRDRHHDRHGGGRHRD